MIDRVCTAKCEHIRAFWVDFIGKVRLSKYHGEREATCALKPEIRMIVRGLPVCWKEVERERLERERGQCG